LHRFVQKGADNQGIFGNGKKKGCLLSRICKTSPSRLKL